MAEDQPLHAPSYEILKELVNRVTDTSIQTLHHVKLSKPHIVRFNGAQDYAEVEYVLVGAARLNKEDALGRFTFEETTVIASDEDAEVHEAFLYYAPRALTVEEALFAIGEV